MAAEEPAVANRGGGTRSDSDLVVAGQHMTVQEWLAQQGATAWVNIDRDLAVGLRPEFWGHKGEWSLWQRRPASLRPWMRSGLEARSPWSRCVGVRVCLRRVRTISPLPRWSPGHASSGRERCGRRESAAKEVQGGTFSLLMIDL